MDGEVAEGGLKPLVVYDGHVHPLVFLENSGSGGLVEKSDAGTEDKSKDCKSCGKPCDDSSPAFSCPTCDFTVHLLCGPLPRALERDVHPHSLVLKDFLEAYYDDEFWYCDSCELVRDKRAPVYYSEGFNYCAEVKCVMPEIVLALTGKSGEVELRTLGRWGLAGKVISKGLTPEEVQNRVTEAEQKVKPSCFHENILQSLTENDRRELEHILSSDDKLFDDLNRDFEGKLDTLQCLDEEFVQLVARLDSVPLTGLTESWDLTNLNQEAETEQESKDVRVPCLKFGDALVPEKLATVYKDLHKKFGDDLSAGSGLSPNLKSVFFLFLCQTVEGMWAVKVIDITEDVLTNWFISIKAVQRAGFKVQFAIDALRKILRAYFGIRVMNYDNNISREISSLERKKETLKQYKGKLKEHLEYFDNVQPSLRYWIDEAPEVMHLAASELVVGIKGEVSRSSTESETTEASPPSSPPISPPGEVSRSSTESETTEASPPISPPISPPPISPPIS